MDAEQLAEMETMFLAFSDRTRLRILGLMADGEVSVNSLSDALGQSQPKISRHLAYLRSSGLVSTRRDGKWIFYKIEPPLSAAAANVLSKTLEWLNPSSNEFKPEPSTNEIAPERQVERDTHEDYIREELEIYLL